MGLITPKTHTSNRSVWLVGDKHSFQTKSFTPGFKIQDSLWGPRGWGGQRKMTVSFPERH